MLKCVKGIKIDETISLKSIYSNHLDKSFANEPTKIYRCNVIMLLSSCDEIVKNVFVSDFEMALLIEVETVKELFFGGAFGLCAGIAARYAYVHLQSNLS